MNPMSSSSFSPESHVIFCEPEIFEIRAAPTSQTAIYKDRNYDMVGLDGRSYGRCIPFPGDDISCSEVLRSVGGKRQFRCLTRFTVKDIIGVGQW